MERPIHSNKTSESYTAKQEANFETLRILSAQNYKQKFVTSEYTGVTSMEIIDRFKKVIVSAANHILSGVRQYEKRFYRHLPQNHQTFHESVFTFFLKGLESTYPADASQKSPAGGKSSLWKNILWISRDIIRFQVSRILSSLLSEALPILSRVSFISSMLDNLPLPALKRILSSCLAFSLPLSN